MQHLPYKRSARVATDAYQIIAEAVYQELNDPRLKNIQLTGSEMTDDLQILKIYYYIEGSEEARKKSLKGLMSAKGYLRKAISNKLGLRVVPDIRYYFDEGIEKAEKLDKIFEDLNNGDQAGEEDVRELSEDD